MSHRLTPAKIAVLSLFCLATLTSAGNFYMVKVSDFLGHEEYTAMTQEEFSKTLREIKAENMLWGAAQRMSEIEWNKTPRPCRYPGRSLHQRRARVYKRFRTQKEAENAVMKKQDQISRAEEKKATREAERERMNRRSRRGRSSRGPSSRQRREEREAKHMELLEQANELFSANLQKLMAERERKQAEHAAKMKLEMSGKPIQATDDNQQN